MLVQVLGHYFHSLEHTALAGLIAYGQTLDTLETVGGGFLGGDSKKVAYEKLNDVILTTDSLAYNIVTDTLTAGAPTAAEITAALGFGPTAVIAGMKYYILDATGTALIYTIISDGTNWHSDSTLIAQ